MRAVARSILRDAIARSLTSKPTDPGVGAWTPAQLYLASEQGAWYDPSDFERYIGEKGPELILDPEFNNAGNWAATPSWTVSGGVATHNGSVVDYIFTATEAPVVGKWYELTVTATAIIGVISVYCGQTPAAMNITTPGTRKIVVQCSGAGLKFSLRCSNAGGGNTVVTSFSAKELTGLSTATMFQDAAGTIPVTAMEQSVGRILDKSGLGNHASQVTAASRPVLSARVNMLTYSEDFTAAAWTKMGVTAVANSATASDGSVTADKLVPAATNTVHIVYANASGITMAAGQRWTGSVDLKADGCGFCYVELHGGAPKGFCVNLATGAITNASAGLIAGTVEDLGDGWWRANVTGDTSAAYVYLQLYPRATAGDAAAWLGDGVNGVLMSRAQLTQSAAPTRYQRVNTATVYDSVGFPHYLKFDDVDDYLRTTFPNLGSNVTIGRSIPGTGASILTGQTIGAGNWDGSTSHCALVIIDRALTGPETALLTEYLNTRAGAPFP